MKWNNFRGEPFSAEKPSGKKRLMNPRECPILKANNDQISSCYVNPVDRCISFYACLQILIENKVIKK